jgi:hypothetical protein
MKSQDVMIFFNRPSGGRKSTDKETLWLSPTEGQTDKQETMLIAYTDYLVIMVKHILSNCLRSQALGGNYITMNWL